MKRISILAVIAGALACGGSTPKPATFTQPAGTVAVNFAVDDTANKVWKDKEMSWKGSMLYDTASNKVAMDATWGGPFAPLYDDGPWTAGGHEPIGATAGDHIFGVTVFVTPPATGSDTYSYGLCDAKFSSDNCAGTGWVWQGSSNGSFSVAAGATAPIKADGQSFKPFGTTDVQLVLDKTAVPTTFDTSKIEVKGSAWGWQLIPAVDDGTKGDATAGDKKYTFQMSSYVGAGNQYYHTGLTASGDKPQFIFVLNGVEYKVSTGAAATAGVSAFIKPAGASTWTAATIAVNGDKNTFITIP